jgi:hypothetical protein
MKILKHKKKFIGSVIFSCSAVAFSLYVNLNLPSTEKIVETVQTSTRTYPASAQTCPINWGATGDRCLGGLQIGYYETYQRNGAQAMTSTSGNIDFVYPEHCAAVGGNCFEVYDANWSEYGTYEEYWYNYRCFSGATSMSPDGSEDTWSNYGSNNWTSNMISCSGGGGPTATGCWTAVELGAHDGSCSEGGAPGGGEPSVTTPQGTTINASGSSMSGTYPSCGGNLEGGSINTTTYPGRVCFMNFNEPYNSYQNGCISSSHINTLMIDGGTCSAPPSYNCEAGSINPSLSIVSSNSLVGVALNSGMRWFHNVFYGACFNNTSGLNYFVPTKTQTELNSFRDHLPAGVSKANGNW